MEPNTEGTAQVETPNQPAPLPFKTQYTIHVVHGDYVVKRPLGPIGTRHFAFIAKCAPSRFDSDGSPMYSPAQEDKAYETFVDWVQKVLKYIIVAYPTVNGIPITFETMPPEDQWGLFVAMSNLMDRGDELFRIVE